MAEHRLCQHRACAHVVCENDRPTHAVIALRDGDTVRLESPAEVRRLRRTLEACEDMLRQAGRGR